MNTDEYRKLAMSKSPPDFIGKTDLKLELEELRRAEYKSTYSQIENFIDLIDAQIALGVPGKVATANARNKLQELRQRAIERGYL